MMREGKRRSDNDPIHTCTFSVEFKIIHVYYPE